MSLSRSEYRDNGSGLCCNRIKNAVHDDYRIFFIAARCTDGSEPHDEECSDDDDRDRKLQ